MKVFSYQECPIHLVVLVPSSAVSRHYSLQSPASCVWSLINLVHCKLYMSSNEGPEYESTGRYYNTQTIVKTDRNEVITVKKYYKLFYSDIYNLYESVLVKISAGMTKICLNISLGLKCSHIVEQHSTSLAWIKYLVLK